MTPGAEPRKRGRLSRSRIVPLRVVFDTNTVISALLFAQGRLAWLRQYWRDGLCVSLISSTTALEVKRVLQCPKFRLSPEDQLELLSDYLPYCETVKATEKCSTLCRDRKDQPFLDLAQSGKADLLVTGDNDLLSLAGETVFTIESPEAYRCRVFGG